MSIDVDDAGWVVATTGFQLETGDIPVRVTNSRREAVDVAVFLPPAGYEPGGPGARRRGARARGVRARR